MPKDTIILAGNAKGKDYVTGTLDPSVNAAIENPVITVNALKQQFFLTNEYVSSEQLQKLINTRESLIFGYKISANLKNILEKYREAKKRGYPQETIDDVISRIISKCLKSNTDQESKKLESSLYEKYYQSLKNISIALDNEAAAAGSPPFITESQVSRQLRVIALNNEAAAAAAAAAAGSPPLIPDKPKGSRKVSFSGLTPRDNQNNPQQGDANYVSPALTRHIVDQDGTLAKVESSSLEPQQACDVGLDHNMTADDINDEIIKQINSTSLSENKQQYLAILKTNINKLTLAQCEGLATYLLNHQTHLLKKERDYNKNARTIFFSRSTEYSNETRSMHAVIKLLLTEDNTKFIIKKGCMTDTLTIKKEVTNNLEFTLNRFGH